MEYLISIGIFIGICAVLVGIVLLVNFLRNKFNIKDNEIELGLKIISLLAYIAQKSGIKYSGDIGLIARYVIQAVTFVEEFNDQVDNQEKLQLIQDEALQICKDNGIPEDETLIQLISEIAEYFVV